jgi:hypothetical protein
MIRVAYLLFLASAPAFCAVLNFDLISSESRVRCELGSDSTVYTDPFSTECTNGGPGRFVHVEAHSDITGIGGLMSAEGTPTNLSFRANTTTSLTISGLEDRDTPAAFRFVTRCVGTGGHRYRFSLVIDGETQASRTCTEGAEFFSVARLVSGDTPIIIGMSVAGELARQSSDSSFSGAGGSMEFWDATLPIPEPDPKVLLLSGVLILIALARGGRFMRAA